MTHDEIDVWSVFLAPHEVRRTATYACQVETEWLKIHLCDVREVWDMMAWLQPCEFRPCEFRSSEAAHVAGQMAIELCIIVAIWPLPLGLAFGRGGR